MSGDGFGPNSGYARELAELRAILDGPSVGVRQAGQIEDLRRLIRMYPEETARYLREFNEERSRHDAGEPG